MGRFAQIALSACLKDGIWDLFDSGLCDGIQNFVECATSLVPNVYGPADMIFIIRLFPEITIKSTPVRKRWSKKLVDNLRILARRIDETATVVLDWDRIVLRTKGGDQYEAPLVEMLASTPGIAHYSRVHAYEFETMHDIYEHTLKHWQDRLTNKTFCVRAKRSGKHDFNSNELERYVGGGLNQHTDSAGVKLKNPDETVLIEVKDQHCYIVEHRCQGLGGFPLGTQDDVLSLVSGGYDSTVASYLMMRRGIKTHYCFFNLGGREHELAVKELAFLLWNKFGASHRVKFVSVPFEEVVAEILANISPSNMGVVLKRMMLRAAEQIMERGAYSALVTGEAISQVSSQTLSNLNAIDRVTEKLVLRPLITMDKPEIISLAREIGTAEFSAAIPEYCGVISVKPSASVNYEKLQKEEALFDLALIDKAVQQSKAKLIDEVMDDIAEGVVEPELVSEVEPNDLIVDIRHPNETDIKPLLVEGREVISMPFYSLNSRIAEFEKQKRYWLYCDRGVISKLHAAHLIEQGLTNVGVYRP